MCRRLLVLFLILIAPAVLDAEPPGPKPKLAVLVVFDQMRGDYLERWNELFVAEGFRRLETEGAWFTNCHYPYAMTATGPGHASLLTGCSPDRHGIVANNWYDRASAAAVYCASSPRYERVPPLPKADEAKGSDKKSEETKSDIQYDPKPRGFGAPLHLLVPTLGDVLKEATQGQGKVFGLSLKDRSAILPCGRKPDGCYWFDQGQLVTSTYYGGRLHPWVSRFNEEKFADQWQGKSWDRLRPELDYAKHSGADDVEGEGPGAGKFQGRIFPHPMNGKVVKPLAKEYYDAVAMSPYGNELLLELAKRAVVEERLGQRDVPDLLVISFSSNDLIGHNWGPDSQEVLDVTLRSDLIIRDLLSFLDRQLGKSNYVLAVSADHGVCPLPEVARQSGNPGARLAPLGMLGAAQQRLQEIFARDSDEPARWIETANEGGIYLNRRLIESRGLAVEEVAREFARWLAYQPGIHGAYTAARLRSDSSITAEDAIGRRVKKSFMPDRSGDVLFVVKPYTLVWLQKTGTSHGSPHPYDTHVPLLIFGPGVVGGKRGDPVTPQSVAAILAQSLGVAQPANSEAPVPAGLFRRQ
jgi:predicted AlkP superfamily pyrophosphatase or phosphodiesterase